MAVWVWPVLSKGMIIDEDENVMVEAHIKFLKLLAFDLSRITNILNSRHYCGNKSHSTHSIISYTTTTTTTTITATAEATFELLRLAISYCFQLK